ncbi:MAG: hypothetical protein MR455_08605 [Prevotella sp.]|nr:hypothetical protein [Prevotella sp.]
MFDNKRKVFEYFKPGKFFVKYVVIREINGKKDKIAIVAFARGKRKEDFWIAGFVPTAMQNKGLGIYSGIAGLNELFKIKPSCTAFSASYSHNTRAVRATTSMGFHINVQDDKHFESSLTREQFDNDFVRQIKKRCNIE